MADVINLTHISVNFDGQAAISDLSLKVAPHEILVLVGESGGGKTTILRTVSGLVQPTNGHITVNGLALNATNLRQIRLNMGYVLQQISLFPNMTIGQNLTLLPEIKHQPKKQTQQLIQTLMAAAQLPLAYLSQYPSELSGGEQQRVGIIRAFLGRPALILMDEPFSALDPVSREQLQDLTLAIHHRFHTTILFVTHDMNEALKMGQRIGVVKDGRILQLGTPDDLVRRPSDPYVQTLFKGSEARKTDNIYIRRLLLADFGQSQPYPNLPIVTVTGDTPLAACYAHLAAQQQLAITQNGQILGYLDGPSVWRFLAAKAQA
ncbi:ABC superfamily ATP binding cassette transporter, ABC protein [Agrilactobacillus composti DSM 18527 = JCM 14202]|uniref:ABC-type quaternary amine transporter n=1 Tax=Agrilactobacillus composti DSM 18527 = JCM 14202 TaxID=1423734 RepID=X0PI82_9LACO|nr:ABC transporter ATP-binding protein [Agrilactobacillus composti]KRM32910.1 ABC superfamily ATP binding cassette transporter, ABC protein [Agrilactobacillus composti DSM 18527 = JCM 14202]GAF41904.1 L-proline glycine betaine ABC transport system permease protein ProV [Agrilactobacillus composti DSM 18527 = JCM 14202]